MFFLRQSVDSLVDAMLAFEKFETRFSPSFIRNHAGCFDTSRFRSEIGNFVRDKFAEYRNQEQPNHLYAAV